ncbi:DAK2 domain-containing protein [Modestobacter sp. I12A-02628]|uniref:DAK2 domain-containing protein n=1 Tax=Goekera deserti TaxID=2497753 RepID=A0A7K3WGY5_9ACTN|nr:DAK2 domain-containing protein [Goekera deserti]MPQ97296.1 DAK2 domain-containing protein [Goekera deserti]NDI50193.1 DAK2 domain-containing protein [Goekera deserti]NEL55761.1 DAK2 domain-containing protein [Goekera deserti]
MLQELDDAAVRRWSEAAVAALDGARSQLDALNVFPVPDGDTGTNLLLTLRAGIAAVADADPGEPAWTALARGAVLGAHGNSGAILSQLLSGLAAALPGGVPAGGAAVARALHAATDAAYGAVADPAEGTLLTVARRGSEAAVRAVAEGRSALADVLGAAADAARVALTDTTGQLEALRAAGVVDAGGAGWCVLLDALVATVTGVDPARVRLPPAAAHRRPGRLPDRHERREDVPHQPPRGPGSEVQYLLADASAEAVADLRTRLAALGDSLVVVGVDTPSGREWNVHVHVDDVGAAIEAGIESGRPHRITVTPLAPPRPQAAVPGLRAVVTVVAQDGLAEVFAAEGAVVVPVDPAGDEQQLEEAVLAAALGSGAEDVVVLPNDEHTYPVAVRAARRARTEGRQVAVLPTGAAVQGLAAVAVADPGRSFSDDVIAMTEAAAATRWAEVTVAEQEALTMAGRCQPGDVLGSADGDVVVLGPDPLTVACDLLDRMLSAGGEMATLVVGEDAALGDAVCRHLSRVHPTVDTVRYDGGPSGSLLLVGVE